MRAKRTSHEHEGFVALHRECLVSSSDEALQTSRRFLDTWNPDQYAGLGWPEDMKDQNIVFALESERLAKVMIHDRPAARELWARLIAADQKDTKACPITGDSAPVARLYPAIKGVRGRAIVGRLHRLINLDAFTSYGHEQGDNAPVSEAAAFAYPPWFWK